MALTLVTSDLIGGLDYSKLTGTVPTWNQNTTGSAATLTTARNIGGVSFNGSVAINLPGVNTAGNQNTSGTAAGLSATLAVGSGGTGVTSITALKNVLDDETWTFANHITATGTLTVNGTGNSAFSGDLYIVGKKLDISAPSGGNAYVKFSDTNSGAKIWRVGTSLSSRGVFNIYNQTDDSFPFNVLANGNVGIGTTAPHTLGSSNLSSHMNLQVHSSSSTAAHIISSGGVNGSVMLEHRNASANSKIWRLMSSGGTFSVNALNDNTGVKTSALSISSGGNATFTPSGGSVVLGSNGFITSTQALNAATAGGRFIGSSNRGVLGDIRIEQTAINADGGYMRFMTSPNGSTSPTEKLRITSAGEIISKKGIEFQGTGLGSGQTGVASSGSGGDLRFYTNGTQSVTIKSDGKVGIGTASPIEKLQVAGQIISTGSNSTSATAGAERAIMDLSGFSSTDHSARFGHFRGTNSAGAGQLRLYTDSVERLRIDASGKVGIGTTSPSAGAVGGKVLHLVNSGATASMRVERSGASTAGTLSITSGNTSNGLYSTGAKPLILYTNSTERLTITSGGEFQLGTGVYTSIQFDSNPASHSGNGGLDIEPLTSPGSGTANWYTRFKNRVGGGTTNHNVTIDGSLSKGSGSFKIDHPLEEKKDTHYLVHSFVEAPQADNIYRGKVDLENGYATVNIDAIAGMTEGTFVSLNTDIQCFTSNESDWYAIRGSVEGNILTIECQNSESTATVSWLVIGERQDQHMYDTEWTDENGKIIVEPLKEINN